MAKRWYAVHVLSNFEKKVAEGVRESVKQHGLEDEIEGEGLAHCLRATLHHVAYARRTVGRQDVGAEQAQKWLDGDQLEFRRLNLDIPMPDEKSLAEGRWSKLVEDWSAHFALGGAFQAWFHRLF